MNKLANKISIAGCKAHWLLSLLIVTLLLTLNAAAYAQGAGNVGKGAQSNNPGPNQNAACDITATYDKRFPFMAAQRKCDTHTKTAEGTKNEESDEGSSHQTMAYAPVIKLCDTCHYGIAYMQIPMIANNKTLQSRDDELFKNTLTVHGMPLSDTQFQVIQRENHQRFLEQLYDPEKMMWAAQATAQMQGSAAANSTAGTAEQSFGTALDRIVNADGGNCLINVANEASGAGFPGRVIEKTIPEAVGMVQTMYKHVFVPMAILFLLPGAVASQVKGQIGRGFNLGYNEANNPFEGILRSIVAIFLIPGTQVIVSWSIDTGNSMAMSVRDWVDTGMIQDWANQLSYNTKQTNDQNVVNKGPLTSSSGGKGSGTGAGGSGSGLGSLISSIGSSIGGTIGSWISSLGANITASGGDGLGAQEPEGVAVSERVGNLSQIMQLSLNTMMNMASIFLVVLGAYQIVMICYLYLLGPLAAAFYAWPQLGGSSKLFRGVFGNWVEAVVQVSLWRFYWMVVLAVMTQRLIYTNGGTSDLQWEVCMFTCFLGILLWAPANPFTFSPQGGLAKAEEIAKANKDEGKGGGGGGGGGKGDEKGSPAVGGAHGGDHGKADGQHNQHGQHEQVSSHNQGEKDNQSHSPQNKSGEDGKKDDKDKVGAAPPMHGDQSAQNNNASPVVNTPPPPGEKGNDNGGNSSDKEKSAAPVVSASASINQGGMPQGQAPVPLAGGAAKTSANPSANPSANGGGDEKGGGDESSKAGGAGSKGNTTVVAGGGGNNNASASGTASSSAEQNVQRAAGQASTSGGTAPPKEKKDEDKNK